MSISSSLLPEYDHEMAVTRKVLERLPQDKFGWKPHEKSMTIRQLANHLAELPTWMGGTIAQDSLDMSPPGQASYQPPDFGTAAEVLASFDKNVSEGRQALAGASDENLMGNWTLLMAGQTIFTMPRVAVIRTWVMNHAVHHRGQLSVYLRLNDVPVPSIYGPSADDPGM